MGTRETNGSNVNKKRLFKAQCGIWSDLWKWKEGAGGTELDESGTLSLEFRKASDQEVSILTGRGNHQLCIVGNILFKVPLQSSFYLF